MRFTIHFILSQAQCLERSFKVHSIDINKEYVPSSEKIEHDILVGEIVRKGEARIELKYRLKIALILCVWAVSMIGVYLIDARWLFKG
jgi:hypothetical protein